MVDDDGVEEAPDLGAARADLQRLGWAPVVANGAAMVAMAGIVGGAPSPDTTLSALTLPTAIFGLGLGLGALAIQASGTAQLTNARHKKAEDQYFRASEEMLFFGADAPFKGHLFTAGEEPPPEPREPFDIERLISVSDQLHRLLQPTIQARRQTRFWRLVATASGVGSLAAFALGLSTLLVGHSLGWLRLEAPSPPEATPLTQAEYPVPASSPAPAPPAGDQSGSPAGAAPPKASAQ